MTTTARTTAIQRGAPASLEKPSASLRTSLLWSVIGQGVLNGSQWFMMVAIARWETPEATGQMALALSICAPAILFASLQLRNAIATDVAGHYRFADYLGLGLLTVPVALVAVAAIGAFLTGSTEAALAVAAVGLAKGADAVGDMFYGLMQQQGRIDLVGKSILLKAPLSLLAVGLIALAKQPIYWAGAGWAIISVAVLVGFDGPQGARLLRLKRAAMASKPGRGEVFPRWNPTTVSALAGLLLPLGLVTGLITLQVNIPSYFVAHYLGDEKLGIYAALFYLSSAGGLLINAVGQGATPYLAAHHAKGEARQFRNLLLVLMGLALGLGGLGVAGTLLVGPFVLRTLYRPEFACYSPVLVWLMIAAAAGYQLTILWYALTSTREFTAHVLPWLLSAVACALAAFFLVPRFGLPGAAWSASMAYVITGLFYLFRFKSGWALRKPVVT